jgi:hypothetical protein
MQFFTMSTPWSLEVLNLKVSIQGGKSRSLLIVFGTCTIQICPTDSFERLAVEYAVSSSVIVINYVTPRCRSEMIVFWRCPCFSVGLAREIQIKESPLQ